MKAIPRPSAIFKVARGVGSYRAMFRPPPIKRKNSPGDCAEKIKPARPAAARMRTMLYAQLRVADILACNLRLRLFCKLVAANRQFPVGPDEMAGVAAGISLEIVLMLGFGLPELACRNDFRNDLARPKA